MFLGNKFFAKMDIVFPAIANKFYFYATCFFLQKFVFLRSKREKFSSNLKKIRFIFIHSIIEKSIV